MVTLKDNTVFIQADEDNIPIGPLDAPHVRKYLSMLNWQEFDDELRRATREVTYNYYVCPQCGNDQFREKQEVDGVKFGFCRECLYTVHIDRQGRWHGYPERPAYRHVIDKLAG